MRSAPPALGDMRYEMCGMMAGHGVTRPTLHDNAHATT